MASATPLSMAVASATPLSVASATSKLSFSRAWNENAEKVIVEGNDGELSIRLTQWKEKMIFVVGVIRISLLVFSKKPKSPLISLVL